MNSLKGGDYMDKYIALKHYEFDDMTYLAHYGRKGQRWGNRKYQNSDGSLTPLGRIHYGVGKARQAGSAIGKKVDAASKQGASNLKNSIRKAIKPTDEELLERYNKSKEKYDRAKLKTETKRLNEEAKYLSGRKRKKLKDMTDEEIQNKLRRLENERRIKALEKEENQGTIGKFIDNYVKPGIGQGLQSGISNVVNKKVSGLVKENKEVKYSDLLREKESKLKLDVLSGDKDRASSAAERLSNLRNATSKKGNDNKGSSGNQGNNSNNNNN